MGVGGKGVGGKGVEGMGVGGKGVEGMGVEDMEEEPSDVVVNHGVAPWPRLGARGASKSSLSWVIRRQTKPCLSLYLFRSAFLFRFSRNSISLEPLRSVSIVALLLSRLAARSSSSVAESMDLPQKLGNDESEPRRRRAADMEGA